MRQRTIVVVEDEPVIRMIAAEVLKDAGFEVVEFRDAEAAILFCTDPDNKIAGVFTDINMPGALDGLDLAGLVVTSRPEAVVVVTSGRYPALPTGSPKVRFLPKPWTEASLLAALRDAI